MTKIALDKYYTPKDLAKYCIEKTFSEIQNISEIIEPSAGNGSFSEQLNDCIAYDIEPENDNIIKQDFLELDIPYKKDRLIIGNPPFGEKMYMVQKFYEKSTEIADYIAFILPITQYNNTNSLYKFDLLHSEDLGKINFSDRQIHCCFNIYKRPLNGFNKRKQSKLKTVKIIRQDSKKYNEVKDYDLRMCYWGDACAGKILSDNEKYAAEYKFIIADEFKDKVCEVLKNVKWEEELNFTAMKKIQQFHIVKILKKYVEGIY